MRAIEHHLILNDLYQGQQCNDIEAIISNFFCRYIFLQIGDSVTALVRLAGLTAIEHHLFLYEQYQGQLSKNISETTSKNIQAFYQYVYMHTQDLRLTPDPNLGRKETMQG